MDRRLQLQTILEQLLGSRNVYFQPTHNVQMQYPAIVYKLDYNDLKHADNLPYNARKRYLVTSIDRDPDSPTPDKLALLRSASFERAFTADGLNHVSYKIYY